MATSLELMPERWLDYEPPGTCHDFGIGEAIAGILSSVGVGAETAATAGPILAGIGEGAAGGAAISGLTGGNPLTGALGGAISGGFVPAFGPAIGTATGLGTTAGDVIAGVAGGTVGSAITRSSPLLGAATGGASGLLAGAFAPTGAGASATEAASPGPAFGGGTPAGGLAGPAAAGTGGSTTAAPSAELTGNLLPGGALGGTTVPAATASTGGTSMAASGGDFGGGGGESEGIGSTIGNWLTHHPGVLLGGALLAPTFLMGNRPVPGLAAVQGAAGAETALGNEALQGLRTGAVPPGAQTLLDQLSASAKTKVRNRYAELGLTGSTMEAQDLANVDQEIGAQKFRIIDQLTGTGLKALGMAGTLDQAAMNAQVRQDEQLQLALGRFAAALAGGGFGTTANA